jgi:hypothetical protein
MAILSNVNEHCKNVGSVRLYVYDAMANVYRGFERHLDHTHHCRVTSHQLVIARKATRAMLFNGPLYVMFFVTTLKR